MSQPRSHFSAINAIKSCIVSEVELLTRSNCCVGDRVMCGNCDGPSVRVLTGVVIVLRIQGTARCKERRVVACGLYILQQQLRSIPSRLAAWSQSAVLLYISNQPSSNDVTLGFSTVVPSLSTIRVSPELRSPGRLSLDTYRAASTTRRRPTLPVPP